MASAVNCAACYYVVRVTGPDQLQRALRKLQKALGVTGTLRSCAATSMRTSRTSGGGGSGSWRDDGG